VYGVGAIGEVSRCVLRAACCVQEGWLNENEGIYCSASGKDKARTKDTSTHISTRLSVLLGSNQLYALHSTRGEWVGRRAVITRARVDSGGDVDV